MPRFEFKQTEHFGAGSVGEPGQRFFFVIAGRDDGWVRAWMEKEQLLALAEGFAELLKQVEAESLLPEQAPPPAEPPGTLLGEFHVSGMDVGYDSARRDVVLTAHAADDDGGEPALVCYISREQAGAIARQAAEVCASGRPICTMCHQPIDPSGHLCPRSNGHSRTGL